jgi:anti-sigma regulatory factor (Ser/Thr protein kinase)
VNAAAGGPFVHEALFYRSGGEFLAATVPFVRAGLAAGEPVLVAVPPTGGARLRKALGADAERVRFEDITTAGRNPGRLIPWVYLPFLAENPGARVRMIGEPVWPGRTAMEYPPCVQHEAVINMVFAGWPISILCPYQAMALGTRAVADAACTHPVVVDGDGRTVVSGGYSPPEQVAARFNQPLPPPPAHAVPLAFDGSTLAEVRAATAGEVLRAGLPAADADDLVLAVGEVAANAVRHGGGSGTLWLWHEAEVIAAQIRDGGHVSDPLAGRLPPPPASPGGHGLLVVNLLCDLVRRYTGESGTTTLLHYGRWPHTGVDRREPANVM